MPKFCCYQRYGQEDRVKQLTKVCFNRIHNFFFFKYSSVYFKNAYIDKMGIQTIVFLFLHENIHICCMWLLEMPCLVFHKEIRKKSISCGWNENITKTYLYNFYPPYTLLLCSKTGVYRGIHCFSYFWSKT